MGAASAEAALFVCALSRCTILIVGGTSDFLAATSSLGARVQRTPPGILREVVAPFETGTPIL